MPFLPDGEEPGWMRWKLEIRGHHPRPSWGKRGRCVQCASPQVTDKETEGRTGEPSPSMLRAWNLSHHFRPEPSREDTAGGGVLRLPAQPEENERGFWLSEAQRRQNLVTQEPLREQGPHDGSSHGSAWVEDAGGPKTKMNEVTESSTVNSDGFDLRVAEARQGCQSCRSHPGLILSAEAEEPGPFPAPTAT
ncbi:uncharacterized protein LOC143272005 isoform X1 [Peromyscus maniculatus bairdii]|uniref:uncharacterized protein LOC143272005 isoform X1 n=1 Tax=Peromyscus maniculatus bairdii TaxID=230844 RepID=UPI003FD34904